LVSSSIDVFSDWSDVSYRYLCRDLFEFLFGIHKPGQLKVGPIQVSKVHSDLIVVCRIILCDNLVELQTVAKTLELKATVKRLYMGGQNEQVNDNMFNFISTPWTNLYVPNTIATLKPEKLVRKDFATDDKLNFLMFLVHSLGKFYVIYESMESICANLEWSSWYLRRIFETYESGFCWLQRIFLDITKNLDKIENEMRELVWPLTRIKTAPDAIALIERQYAGDFLGVNIGGFISVAQDLRLKKYTKPTSKGFSGEEFLKKFIEGLESLAEAITYFVNQFKDTSNSWKELQRSDRAKNQLLVTLFGVISTLILNVIIRLL